MNIKLSADRRWCLSWWEGGGWSMGRPMDARRKKWATHILMLVKGGLLEADDRGELYRITDAGLDVLAQGEKP